ncbi:hypothetical protein H6B13_12235 [Bacteroides gallinaceum]|uniref:hypothetical protein n=1 Tax=Bacteroides gallinaceum TaxID=1462571 RepID=UPI0019587E5C|nr:hypothetical protein [Bacteroides gallinaceum]MBM6720386.1 hypothetical protein [Bacteroides gallinaceum]
MKAKLFFSVVAMLSLVSCTEDIDIELKDEVSPVEKVVFSAFMENYAESRTGISDYPTFGYYSLFWTRGDAISIYDGRNTAVFTTENDKSSFAEFVLTKGQIDDEASEYKAFYPSTITVYNQELPATQHYVENNVENFPMYAYSQSKDLKFKNLCGIIQLSLKNGADSPIGVSSIGLSSVNSGMSGEFTIGIDGAAEVEGTGGVVLVCEKTVSLSEFTETDFNIIVPQGEYDPLRVDLHLADGKVMQLASTDKVSVKRSGMTRIELTLSESSYESSLEMIPVTEADVDFTDR